MSVLLYRIDDRLIHGQVVVGWGQSLNAQFIVLVDDDVAESDWEQELYRMGVPPDMHVYFHTVDEMTEQLARYQADARRGLLLVGTIDTMSRLVAVTDGVREINLGGVHHAVGRVQRRQYVFLTPDEAAALQALQQQGVRVSAQDVPTTRAVPLDELLTSRPTS